jgi:hypothetical protein
LLGKDSGFVGPREKVRTGFYWQAHPGGDEVVHDSFDGGAVEDASPKATISSMMAMPPLTVTQASTAASPMFLSGPPPSSPLYLANAASSGKPPV